MEGTSPGRKRRFRIHREFECSRIEQAMLAAAYRRVLPEDGLSFAESNRDPTDRCQEASQLASQDNTDSKPSYVSAIGGY